MPTIEIASLQSATLELDQADFDVAIIIERELSSHRSLFFDFLAKQKGTIIHVGNPAFKNDQYAGYFAGQIIDWQFDPDGERFQFRSAWLDDIRRLLNAALDSSPIGQICFLTDYQFGPETAAYQECESLEVFWAEHDRNGLMLNTLYTIQRHDG